MLILCYFHDHIFLRAPRNSLRIKCSNFCRHQLYRPFTFQLIFFQKLIQSTSFVFTCNKTPSSGKYRCNFRMMQLLERLTQKQISAPTWQAFDLCLDLFARYRRPVIMFDESAQSPLSKRIQRGLDHILAFYERHIKEGAGAFNVLAPPLFNYVRQKDTELGADERLLSVHRICENVLRDPRRRPAERESAAALLRAAHGPTRMPDEFCPPNDMIYDGLARVCAVARRTGRLLVDGSWLGCWLMLCWVLAMFFWVRCIYY